MGKDKKRDTGGQQAGEADTGIIATLRAQNGKMVSSSNGGGGRACI